MADSDPQSPVSPGSALSSPKPRPSPSPSPGPSPSPSSSKVLEKPQLNGTKTNEDPQEDSPQTDQTTETKTEDLKESESGPEEEQEDLSDCVLCDSCMDTPLPAVKSCLTCLVSYCESHLRPHLENPKFQQHRLLDPLRDIERKTCELHQLPLDRFCLPDCVCVCEDCLREDHRGHEQMGVDQARRDIERELKQKQAEMVKTVAAAKNAISKLQANTVSIENSVTEVRTVIDAQFEAMSRAVDRTRRAVTEVLEEQERQALKQAEGIRAHLENRLSDLRKTQGQVQKISRNKSHLDFLQEYSEWKQEATDISVPGVYIGLMDSLNSFSKIIIASTEKLCEMMETEITEKLTEACSNDKSGPGIKTTVRSIVAAKHNQNLPDPQTRADLLQYSRSMSFDANTAHKFLRLTEENRKATNTTPWQHPYPDHPERFEHWRQVLALESIYLDRTYFEVDFSGEGTYLGLSYKSIERKGSESNGCLSSAGASWCLQWTGRAFSAWHGDTETPLSAGATRFSRIGVYVDYTGGLLRFYGFRPETGEEPALIHEYRAEFLEPLYPAFWLSKKENTVTLVGPGEPLRGPSPPTSPGVNPKNNTGDNPGSNGTAASNGTGTGGSKNSD